MNEEITKKQQKRKGGVDFMFLIQSAWKYRSLYYKVFGITLVLACIYAFSLPRVYKCEVMLAPELSTARSSVSLSSIARTFGLKLGSSMTGNGSEALFPTLYPDLMNSVDFKTSLFNIQVCAEDRSSYQQCQMLSEGQGGVWQFL